MPYWPSSSAAAGSTRLRSRMKLSAMAMAEAAGAKYADPVLYSATSSPPPFAGALDDGVELVLGQQLGERHAADGRSAGAAAPCRRRGRRAPAPRCPGSSTFSASATKHLKRAVSSTPAMPTTWCFLKPVILCSAYTIASSGLATLITKAFGQCAFMFAATSFMILRLTSSRSSRLMPGLRGTPAVMITTSLPGDVLPVGGAGDAAVVAVHRRELVDVQRLALHQALGRGDVVEHHVAELLLHREQRQVAADLPAADESDLLLACPWSRSRLSHVLDDGLPELGALQLRHLALASPFICRAKS